MVDMTTRSSGTMPPAPERAAGDLADVDAKPLGRQSAEERAARGKAARASTPLEAHAEFRRADDVDPVELLLGQGIQRRGVLPQLLGRSGERLGDTGAQLALQHREHLPPNAHPGERGVRVLWIVPRHEAGVGATPHGGRPPDARGGRVMTVLSLRPPRRRGRP